MDIAPAQARTNTPRRRGRVWRVAKWGGLVVSVLIVSAGIRSFWHSGRIDFDYLAGVKIVKGSLEVYWYPDNRPKNGWNGQVYYPLLEYDYPPEMIPRFTLWPRWNGNYHSWDVSLPLWMPLTLLVLPTTLLFYREAARPRRAGMGVCMKCGYNRRGLAPGAVCPECGGADATKQSMSK